MRNQIFILYFCLITLVHPSYSQVTSLKYHGKEFDVLDSKHFYDRFLICNVDKSVPSTRYVDYLCKSNDSKDTFQYTYEIETKTTFCQDFIVHSKAKYFGSVFRVGVSKTVIAQHLWGKKTKRKVGVSLALNLRNSHFIIIRFKQNLCNEITMYNSTL